MVETSCLKNCPVCIKLQLQMRWLVAAACFVLLGAGWGLTAITDNRQDITVVEARNIYLVEGINDIKKAMGLEIRMPPKLEALK